jgi:hypothetical protein
MASLRGSKAAAEQFKAFYSECSCVKNKHVLHAEAADAATTLHMPTQSDVAVLNALLSCV